jgi:hypothetical protein
MSTEYASRVGTTEHETAAKTIATGASAEVIAGAAAVVLAIVGLAGMFPMMLAAIGVIVAGVAFLFEGAAVASRYFTILKETTPQHELRFETGLSAEIVGGLAGIVLGILALVGVVPLALLAISAIVFGGALLFGSPTVLRVGRAEPGAPVSDYIARETAAGAAGAQALIGVGVATLGILALVGLVPQTLVLVSVLAVGGSALLTGGALTGKMVSLLYHH